MLTLNRLDVRSPASSSPVSVDDLKTHLRLFGDDSVSDDYLLSLIGAATELTTDILGETVGPSTYEAFYTDFNDLDLPFDRIEVVIMVEYYDKDNNLQLIDPTSYFLDDSAIPPRVRFNEGATPQVTLNSYRAGKVKIMYETNYTPLGSVISQAILIIAADLYTNQTSTMDKQSFKTPVAAQNLLNQYRRQRW